MKERIITLSLFFVVVCSSFYFGFHRLQNFSGVDEPLWSYGRVPTYWKAVIKGNWKKTNISDKPGIPLAIVSGAGLPFIGENPHNYKSLRYEPKTPAELQKIRDIYFKLRLPVFLFTLAILPVLYFLIKKLLGKNIARFSLLFIGLSPILLGISLIINADAMLWILASISTLSLFLYFQNREKKYLLLSAFTLGLSVVDKYVANVLYVYFFLIFLLEYIFFAHQKTPIKKYLQKALVDYLILFFVSTLTVFAFFPATWVKFSKLVSTTVGNDVFSSTWPLFAGVIGLFLIDTLAFKARGSKAVFGFFADYKNLIAKIAAGLFLLTCAFVLIHIYFNLHIFDIQGLIASPKGIGGGSTLFRFSGAIAADFFSLIFSVSPLVLLAILFAALNIFRKKEMDRETITIVYIIIFVFMFYLGSAVNEVVTMVRYQIMVYPLIFVMAAIGIHRFSQVKQVKKYVPLPTIYLASIIILLASLFLVRPFFLAYASEILPKNYIVNLKGMGEGSIEAADYLNKLPGASGMAIWSDKGAVCEAFVGKCNVDFKKKTFEQTKFDYFVVSTDRRSRTLKLSGGVNEIVDFKKLYANTNPVFEVTVSNNPQDFVKVFKASEFLIQ